MILNQDKVWIDRDKNVVPLSAMDERYKRSVIAFLERRAAKLEFSYSMAEIGGLGAGIIGGVQMVDVLSGRPVSMMPSGQMAQDAYERELDERMDHPLKWLRTKPLLRELYRQIGEEVPNG